MKIASKTIKKSWYCECKVHYRALINLDYRDFSGKSKFSPKIHSNQGNFYSKVTLKKKSRYCKDHDNWGRGNQGPTVMKQLIGKQNWKLFLVSACKEIILHIILQNMFVSTLFAWNTYNLAIRVFSCCIRKIAKKQSNYMCPINFRIDEIFAEFFLSSEYYMLSFRHIGPCDI